MLFRSTTLNIFYKSKTVKRLYLGNQRDKDEIVLVPILVDKNKLNVKSATVEMLNKEDRFFYFRSQY